MQSLIQPHGGTLINRIVTGSDAERLEELANGLKRLVLNYRELSDLEMISTGAFSPLEGFVTSKDYESILHSMHLANGLPWTIPITLSIDEESRSKIKEGDQLALSTEAGDRIGVMDIEEIYSYDKRKEALQVYGTDDEEHPGVAAVYRQGSYYLGGSIQLFRPVEHTDLAEYRLEPKETRVLFKEKGWHTIVAFQTKVAQRSPWITTPNRG
jgi:sulfate adenylyltransferase